MARVLVYDDERHIVRLVQVNLERQGHQVETCANDADCLDQLRNGSFDMLVVDGDMPDLINLVESEFGETVKVLPLNSKALKVPWE